MESCDCIETQWPADELLVKYQYISDFFIAFAYFSIPLELIYFVKKSAFFPYRWVLMQFGAFIVLCGATHFINLWTFSMHSKTVAIVMTIAKIATAVVSCLTALMLVHIIPDLLSVKKRERDLKDKAEELDKEMGLIIKQEETGRHVRMLTHEIRSTLDRHTILRTTLVELGRMLDLEECVLWMPSQRGVNLQLSHTLNNLIPLGSNVPSNLPIVNEVFSNAKAVRIPPACPLARIRPPVGRYAPPEVVAVRVPLLHLSNFQINDWPDLSAKSYAVMVLILPMNGIRKWREHELELVQVVADQVAVALSHAAILEESMRARDQLMEQNVALDLARQEAEMAIRARNDFLAVMNHEMRTPMHAIIALSSLLLETELTPDQRVMIETILKSSKLLATLINDILDLSRLEDGTLVLDTETFNLHGVFGEVINLIKPIASVKKLSITLALALDLPLYAIGDENRLIQIILNVVGNAVKFTKKGYVSIEASTARPEYLRNWQAPEFFPVPSDEEFFLWVQTSRILALDPNLWKYYTMQDKVPSPIPLIQITADFIQKQRKKVTRSKKQQAEKALCSASTTTVQIGIRVKDSGSGIIPQDIPLVFTKFVESRSGNRSNGGAGLGLAICKRFVNLMGGHIWIESEGVGNGSTVTFIVKLGFCGNQYESTMQQIPEGRANQGCGDLIGHRKFIKDYDASVPRYQRSL